MSEIIKPLILDETGKAIVEALTQREMTKTRIAEINAAADAAKSGIETKTDEQVARITEVTALAEDVNQLKGEKVNKPTDNPNGEAGQALRTNGDGTTSWAHLGLPTDEQTDAAVSRWLDDHPEATTTVQDKSLTHEKLVNGTLGFVIPQMFGAKADGVTYDGSAVRQALEASDFVYFPAGEYVLRDLTPSASNKKIVVSPNAKIISDGSNWFALNVVSDNVEVDGGFFSDSNIDLYIDNPCNNVRFSNVRCASDGYNVLVNKNSYGGKNLLVEGSVLSSKDADAIEINTASGKVSEEHYDNRFKNVIASNNFANTVGDIDEVDGTKGMTVGIAEGHNVIVHNTISNNSTREGVHVEDGSENVIVTNGIFENCGGQGIRLYLNPARIVEYPIVDNCIFTARGRDNTVGLMTQNIDGSLEHTIGSMTNCMYKYFKIGANIWPDTILNMDGTQIVSCETGMRLLDARVLGTVFLKDCGNPILLNTARNEPSFADRIIIYGNVDVDRIVEGAGTFITKDLEYEYISAGHTSSGTKLTTMLSGISYFDGYVIVDANYAGETSKASHHGGRISKVTIRNGEIEQETINQSTYGSVMISGESFTFDAPNNALQVCVFASVNEPADVRIKVKFVGMLIVQK